jgi:hypothetical protein
VQALTETQIVKAPIGAQEEKLARRPQRTRSSQTESLFEGSGMKRKSHVTARRSDGAFPGAARLVFLFLGSLSLVARSFGSDPSGAANLARVEPLDFGAGIAAYPADEGIAANEHVIFADNFEKGSLGEGWDEIRNKDGKVLSFSDPEDPRLGRRCLQVEARLDRDTGGGLTRWFESAGTIFVRFHTRFAPDCDYIHHFVTLRANRGLRGGDRWSGFGGAGERPGGDARFSTAIEPWGNWGRWPAPGRWNFYSYWHEMEASPDGKFWGNTYGVPDAPVIPRGRWIAVEFMLRHNTPGKPDGEQAFWIDGVLQGYWRGFNWRTTERLMANALTLETYVTDRWTRNPVNTVWFDNLVIARRYIGPTAPAAR